MEQPAGLINIGGQSIFGGHIPGCGQPCVLQSGAGRHAESLGIFQMTVSFLNSAQTKLLINAAESSTNAIVTVFSAPDLYQHRLDDHQPDDQR